MNDVPSAPICDFENEIPLSFPGDETSLGMRCSVITVLEMQF